MGPRSPSFLRMLARYFSTLRTPTQSAAAISLLVLLSPMIRRTYNSACATYVLFLKRDSSPGRFQITGGPQGAFDISTSAVVAADMISSDPLVELHNKTNSTVFLQLVRAACASH